MIAALCAASFLCSAGLWACLWATVRHFRGAPAGPCARPMTLIKPVKGLDDAMEAGFRSIVAADPLNVLQVIVALETADDPAYPVARAFAEARPDRRWEVVLTGPSGPRMGKAHNMIEAAKRARHDDLLFSDADTAITPALLADSARAFAEGAGAVYGLPYHAAAPGLGGWFFQFAFNHAFCAPVALSARLGLLHSFAGAWMGYTKEALSRMGGLERFSNVIAEDYSLGAAARAAGVRQELLREPVRVSETFETAGQAFAHCAKWASIIFWTVPGAVLAAPLLSPTLSSLAALALAAAGGRPLALPLAALAAASVSRVAVGFLQDRFFGGCRMGVAGYAALAGADLGALAFLPLAARRTVAWRGKRYRVFQGGRCEVVENC